MIFKLIKEELKTLDTLLSLRKVGTTEVDMMVEFMRKHVDERTNICTKCPTQIRFAHKSLVRWANNNEVDIDKLRYGSDE